MIGLETPFSPAWLAAGAFLLLAVLAWTYFRLRTLLRPSYLALIGGLRSVALVCLLLLLLNPYSNRSEPDPDGFRVAVLADASGSMDTRDIQRGERSRREWVEERIRNPDTPPLEVLNGEGYWIDGYRFSESLASAGGGDLSVMPGHTALGDVLDEALERADAERDNLGGVLLLSDGHNNFGGPPAEAARRFRDRGIPVSTVGVGARDAPGSVEADFASTRFSGRRGEPVDLPVELANTRDTDEAVRLRVRDGNGTVEEREVVLPAGVEDHREVFSVTPLTPGEHLYRLSVEGSNGSATDPSRTRYAFVSAEEPETFSVLYLASRLTPEYRFIQRGLVDSEEIAVQSIIRTGDDSFFQALSEENEDDAPAGSFPGDGAFLNRFDALFVDTRILGDLSPEGVRAVADFVSIRGGGALFFGPLGGIPEEIAAALPVLAAEERIIGERMRLELEAAPVFGHLEGGRLFGSPALFVAERTPVVVANELKRGARPVLRREGRSDTLMAAQAFGAGRVAYLGTEATWQWRMASDGGMEQHRLFWENLAVWLASAGKPRLSVSAQGEQYALGESFDLEANVLGSDFRPARDASVTVRITDPSGESWERGLQPAFDAPGRYRTSYVPEDAGEYRARYRIAFPDGEVLERDAYFLATHLGTEGEDTSYREALLRDIARVTGGVFVHHSEIGRFSSFPLSETVPVRESREYWANGGWFILFLFASLIAEWFFRRRMGLK